MLAVYPQAAPSSDAIQLWIGIFDNAVPPQPRIAVQKVAGARVELVQAWNPIRDDMADGTGRPINHRAIARVCGLEAGASYELTVTVGPHSRTLVVSTLPQRLPGLPEGGFSIFLCSCYYQPEDASGTLGNVISKITMRPQLTLMMGDQVYGDLPLDVDWPRGMSVARILGEKYMRNFASRALESGGLARVLQRAPVVCVADDHEYWNNYPFGQVQLPNTWLQGGRDGWEAAARSLYEDYQVGAGLKPGFAMRLDVDPLKMILIDMRSDRDTGFQRLLSAQARAEFEAWGSDLLAARAQGRPAFGLLSSGQALFAAPTAESKRKLVDAEMSNWAEFDELIVPTLERLADAGIPVIYVTGDVHWGRVSQARSPLRDPQAMIHEVICSPSTLIGASTMGRAVEGFKGIFGKGQRWPRHSQPAEVPDRLGASTRFELECKVGKERDLGYRRQGDQVAMLTLWSAGGGIDFRVTYYEVSAQASAANPERTPTYSMRNI